MKKTIYVLLLIIIIASSILIYKIKNTPKYNKELYDEIYKEYSEIQQNDQIYIDDYDMKNNNIKENKKGNITYVTENIGDINKNTYRIIGTIEIPKIKISYPVLNEYKEEYLNIAPVKFAGVNPNEKGNCVIIGHNYWSNKFFSNLNKLENGDIVEITDRAKKKIQYAVCDKYEIEELDYSCTAQNQSKKRELTLITCVKYKKNKRLVVKCIEK